MSSNSQRFSVLPEALYRQSFSSIRCAKLDSGSDFSLIGEDTSMDGGFGRPLIMPKPGYVLLIGVFSLA
jgi:hypothetical protein